MRECVSSKLLEKPQLGLQRHDGGCLQQLNGGSWQARDTREYRVAHRWWYRRVAGCQNLGDEEGVAHGLAEELRRIYALGFGQLSHRVRRQRGEVQAGDRLA